METRLANNPLKALPDDVLRLICDKLPRLADVQALCGQAGRSSLVEPILLERLRTGSWTFYENGCQVCNRVRTAHGEECPVCAALAREEEEEEEEDSDSDYQPSETGSE
jgi:hypothetical protein